MTRWRRFVARPSGERRTLLHAALLLSLSHVLLALAGLDRTRRFVASARAMRVDPQRAEALAHAMLSAARHVPFATTCLDRAAALFWLLSRNGIAAVLRIGVRRGDAPPLAAHAWVEHDGAVLLDEEAAGFTAFDAAIVASE